METMVHELETIVVGGGTAGAAIAGRLAEAGRSVLLLEAGPDFGPPDSGRWPERLLDPSLMPVDMHSWNYVNTGTHGQQGMAMQRARVIGGCSSHNGCAVVWGHRDDYDGWEAAGNPGWGANRLLPYLRMANERFRVHIPERHEITPLHQAMLESAPGAGLPSIADFCDLDITHGLGIGPVNIAGGLRWNAAFAYVDAVRDLPNFTIIGDALVERLVMDGDRVTGVIARTAEGVEQLHAERVVLAGGAYGTPLILQRSGIGDPEDIERHGIAVTHPLMGVGKNLQDHPALGVNYTGTPELTTMLDAFVEQGGMPREEGTIALSSSSRCTGPFDLHLYPIAHRNGPGDWDVFIGAAVMAPRSSGTVRISGADPEALPVIEHCYLTDPENYDLDALVDGVSQVRELAAQEPVASLIGRETGPFVENLTPDQLRRQIPLSSVHDYHPTSTCKMGPISDWMSVVDASGKAHGIENLHIGDASIFPSVTWANTNLPALAVAERIASGLLA
jgi:choline dehydrogenase